MRVQIQLLRLSGCDPCFGPPGNRISLFLHAHICPPTKSHLLPSTCVYRRPCWHLSGPAVCLCICFDLIFSFASIFFFLFSAITKCAERRKENNHCAECSASLSFAFDVANMWMCADATAAAAAQYRRIQRQRQQQLTTKKYENESKKSEKKMCFKYSSNEMHTWSHPHPHSRARERLGQNRPIHGFIVIIHFMKCSERLQWAVRTHSDATQKTCSFCMCESLSSEHTNERHLAFVSCKFYQRRHISSCFVCVSLMSSNAFWRSDKATVCVCARAPTHSRFK